MHEWKLIKEEEEEGVTESLDFVTSSVGPFRSRAKLFPLTTLFSRSLYWGLKRDEMEEEGHYTHSTRRDRERNVLARSMMRERSKDEEILPRGRLCKLVSFTFIIASVSLSLSPSLFPGNSLRVTEDTTCCLIYHERSLFSSSGVRSETASVSD